MVRTSRDLWGNPSSLHGAGREARSALEECRERIAARLDGRSTGIVFTSGGTEANRLAILGALAGLRADGVERPHAVVAAIDHPSTLEIYHRLEAEGALEITRVPARPDGRTDPREVIEALRPATRIVSLLHGSNETGVIQDVRALGEACRIRKIALHCDAVQTLGKVPLRLGDLGADLVSLSSHKIGGPKGVGALWIRAGAPFLPPFAGGPQERRLRPGTENLPGIAGFARACDLIELRGPFLRDRLLNALLAGIPGAVLNGAREALLPNTLNISIPGVASELLLIRLDLEGVCASAGSACSSGAREPSHVLRAMGLGEDRVRSALRLSLGWTTTEEDVDQAAAAIIRCAAELRSAPGAPLRP